MPRHAKTDLTTAFVKSAAAVNGKRTDYSDALCRGLTLRVSPDGMRTFSFRYQDAAGRSMRLRLGDFPALSLAKAREAAYAARAKVGLGGDPQREKQAQRAAAKAQRVRTVAELIDDYLAAAEKRNRASTVLLNKQRLDSHVRPRLGALHVEDVTKGDVLKLMADLERKGHAVTANRCLSLVGLLYRHARRSLDMKLDNPGEGIERYPEQSRERTLSDEELHALWGALDDPTNAPAAISPLMAIALKLCAVTLQRANEVAGMHDREIDTAQKTWLIPAERAKNGRAHLVPLSPLAIELIEEARRIRGRREKPALLFASPRDVSQPFQRHAVTRAMSRLCFKLRIDDAGPHDLRRTGATALTSERIGVPRFHVSAVLGHLGEMGGVTSVYDRHAYVNEKRRALDAWALLLRSIVTSTERPSNIVAMESARA
jgi:integrase